MIEGPSAIQIFVSCFIVINLGCIISIRLNSLNNTNDQTQTDKIFLIACFIAGVIAIAFFIADKIKL